MLPRVLPRAHLIAAAGLVVAVLGAGSAWALQWPGAWESRAERLRTMEPAEIASALEVWRGTPEDSACGGVFRTLLVHEDPSVRIAALRSIARDHLVGLEDAIAERLSDRSAEVRVAACQAIGEMMLETLRRPLGRLVQDPDPAVRVAVAESLARFEDSASATLIAPLARAPEPTVAVAALAALGRLGAAEWSALIGERVGDPDPAVSVAAIRALRDIGASERLPLVASLIRSPRWEESNEAIAFIGQLGGVAEAELLRSLVLERPGEAAAITALTALSTMRPIPDLRPLLPVFAEAPHLAMLLLPAAGETVGPMLGELYRSGVGAPDAMLAAWLATGDPDAWRAAVDAFPGADHEESRAMLGITTRDPAALCEPSTIRTALRAQRLEAWLAQAGPAGAAACLQEVGAALRPDDGEQRVAWVMALIANGETGLAAELVAQRDAGEPVDPWGLRLIAAWGGTDAGEAFATEHLGHPDVRVRREAAVALASRARTWTPGVSPGIDALSRCAPCVVAILGYADRGSFDGMEIGDVLTRLERGRDRRVARAAAEVRAAWCARQAPGDDEARAPACRDTQFPAWDTSTERSRLLDRAAPTGARVMALTRLVEAGGLDAEVCRALAWDRTPVVRHGSFVPCLGLADTVPAGRRDALRWSASPTGALTWASLVDRRGPDADRAAAAVADLERSRVVLPVPGHRIVYVIDEVSLAPRGDAWVVWVATGGRFGSVRVHDEGWALLPTEAEWILAP